jgi:hypothetical protein
MMRLSASVKLNWSLSPGACLRRLGGFAAWLASALALLLAALLELL